MSHRSSFVLAAVGAAFAVTGSAQAVFFSFPSDADSAGFTFRGTAGAGNSFNITQAGNPRTSVELFVDDNNGPLPSVSFDLGFTANMTATHAASTGIGSFFMHTYLVTGRFAFTNRTTGEELLVAEIGGGANQQAIFTVPGSQNSWSSVGAALGSDALGSPLNVTWRATAAFIDLANNAGVNLGNYGIIAGGSSGAGDDFGFDLTVLNAGGLGSIVQINPQTGLPTSGWQSEGSFSGSAPAGIPTPGAASLLALGGLVAARRRR